MNILNLFSDRAGADFGPVIERPAFSRGFNGDLNVEAALAFEDDRIILALDYDFIEPPSYVEFDMASRYIHIVQNTGDVATLVQLTVPLEEKTRILSTSRIALVTGSGDEKLLQVLTLITRNATMKAAA